MSPEGMAAVGLLLTVSLTAFLLFEVYKMAVNVGVTLKQGAICSQILPPVEFFEKIAALQKETDHRTMTQMMPLWRVALLFTVLTALGAIALLFYAFLATLLGWPRWP